MSPQTFSLRNLVQIALFAALIAALTVYVPKISLTPSIPLTLQTFGVLLAGAVLGPRKGPLAVLLYLAVGFAGVPVFSGPSGGIAVLFSPRGGFLVGFVLAAWVAGLVSERFLPRYSLLYTIPGLILAAASVYLVAVPWLLATAPKVIATLGVFIPGDLIKAVVAALLASVVHRSLPGLFERRGRRSRLAPETPTA